MLITPIADSASVESKRNTMTGLARSSALLFAYLVLLTLIACGRDAPVESGDLAEGSPSPFISTVVQASVLITEEAPGAASLLDSIEVSPDSAVLDPGEEARLTARAYGPSGRLLHDVEFLWGLVDPRAGTISKDGVFQAGSAAGEFDNAVSVTGIQNAPTGTRYSTGFASILVVGDVLPPELASIAIFPRSPVVMKHQLYRLRAVALDRDGTVIPGASLVWDLRDRKLGRVNQDTGLLTVEGREGLYRSGVAVTAIWAGSQITASADVEVLNSPAANDALSVHALPQRFFVDPSGRIQLRAVALNGLGELVAGTQLRWTVEDPRAGTVDGRGAFVAGRLPGIFAEAVKVEAVVPGEQGFARAVDFASVVVREAKSSQLRSITIFPERLRLTFGDRVNLIVTAANQFGDAAEGTEVRYEMLTEQAGAVTAHGVFTAGSSPGSYADAVRVTVTQPSHDETIMKTRSIDVVVVGSLARAEISPAVAKVNQGRTAHFTLTGRDANGQDIGGLAVIWTVSDESVGTIDAFGNFTAHAKPGLYEGVIRAEVIQQRPAGR